MKNNSTVNNVRRQNEEKPNLKLLKRTMKIFSLQIFRIPLRLGHGLGVFEQRRLSNLCPLEPISSVVALRRSRLFDKTQKFKHTLRDLPTNRINLSKMKNFWVLKLAYGLPSGLQQYKGIQPILIQIYFVIYKRSKEHKNNVLADQNKASGIFMHQVNQIKILKLKLGAYRLQIRQFSKNHFSLRSLFDGIYNIIYYNMMNNMIYILGNFS